MRHATRALILLLALAALPACATTGLPADDGGAGHAGEAIRWERSVDAAFARAAAEDRLVLLYMEAVWCHWCHVMDHDTYGDARVQEAVAAGYVPLRVDSDARPDLANRYRRWAWPATIVLRPDGTELAKRRGYVEAGPFAALLERLDRTRAAEPERARAVTEYATSAPLPPELRAELQRRHRDAYDDERGGLPTAKRSLVADSAELAMRLGARGDAVEARRARQVLDAARVLVDPVWGGAYQYSHGYGWVNPHFEKIMTIQARYLSTYSEAYLRDGDARDLEAARAVQRWLATMMTGPGGAFYTSQDADVVPGEHAQGYFDLDDAGRRALGIPRIDHSRYAYQNGLLAEALVHLHEATGDPEPLAMAEAAVRWAIAHRALSGGGFAHGDRDRDGAAGPFLADTVAMGRALLALHRATGEGAWLTRAVLAADFMGERFRATDGSPGFLTTAPSRGPIAPVRLIDENVAAGRFANLLARYSGLERHRDLAEHAMRWLATPQVATRRLTEAGILLLDEELGRKPLHVTVVGGQRDRTARALRQAALAVPGWYKRVEHWDPTGAPLMNADVDYPRFDRPAAFVCTASACSPPIFEPEEVVPAALRLGGLRG